MDGTVRQLAQRPTLGGYMDWAEELKDTLRKLNECERMANLRVQDSNERTVNHPKEYYEGQACAYRNAAHYIERLLQTVK